MAGRTDPRARVLELGVGNELLAGNVSTGGQSAPMRTVAGISVDDESVRIQVYFGLLPVNSIVPRWRCL